MTIPASSTAYIVSSGIGDIAGIPKPEQPIARQGGFVEHSWWRFFNILAGPPQQEAVITLGPSPTSFTVPSDCQILIQDPGSKITKIQYTRRNTYTLGFTSGYFPLSDGDTITITYNTGAPTPVCTYFPC